MKVGFLRVDLHIGESRSLKAKRHVLRSLRDRLMSHFNVSVIESGGQDLWQRAELGLAVVAHDGAGAHRTLRKIEEFIRAHPGIAVLAVAREVLTVDPDTAWPGDSAGGRGTGF